MVHDLRNHLLDYATAICHGYRPANHHRATAAKLEAVERGEIKRLMIFMPPRHGKTALASEYFPAWYLGRNAERRIIHATYAQPLADSLGLKVQNQLMNPTYQKIFPGVDLDMTARGSGWFNTSGGGAYLAVGAGVPIAGHGADLLLIDDPVMNCEHTASETMRQRLKDWYLSEAYTKLMPGGAVVIIQTRWHQDDLSGWLLKEHSYENWEVLSLPAVNASGEALWPESYPIEHLRAIRRTVGERDWAALYQQSPMADVGENIKNDGRNTKKSTMSNGDSQKTRTPIRRG